MDRDRYDTDLTDEQWAVIEPLLPQPPDRPDGRKRTVEQREILNAILYLLRAGCAWRLLPHDFPNWRTVYHYFRIYLRNGTWKTIHDSLRERVRIQDGREDTPSAAVVDSQSAKTTEKGGLVAMMLERKSRGGSATSSLTQQASFSS